MWPGACCERPFCDQDFFEHRSFSSGRWCIQALSIHSATKLANLGGEMKEDMGLSTGSSDRVEFVRLVCLFRLDWLLARQFRKTFTDNQIKILKCEKQQLAAPQSGSFTARFGKYRSRKSLCATFSKCPPAGKQSNLKVHCLTAF